MRRPLDLDHDYMLPNGLVQVWLTADAASVDEITATVAYSLGRPPACIVTCPAARLFDDGEDTDSLVQKIIDKTHRLLRAAPSGYHVDCFREVVSEWVCRHRQPMRYLAAA
jgi:hypothetical protein